MHAGQKYNDPGSGDERLWAAVELYNATRGRIFLEYISNSNLPPFGLGWTNTGSYAFFSFLDHNREESGSELYQRMKDRFYADTAELLARRQRSAYGVALDRYVWGSNMDAANAAMHFLLANRLSPDSGYVDATLDQFHYLMGRNATGISYVTCYGGRCALHPHHRPSMARGSRVPGMLVGGPFSGVSRIARDPASALFTKDTPPAKCYADRYESFSTNEICVYWNSPLAYILAYLNDSAQGR
jgi:endoglucanase